MRSNQPAIAGFAPALAPGFNPARSFCGSFIGVPFFCRSADGDIVSRQLVGRVHASAGWQPIGSLLAARPWPSRPGGPNLASEPDRLIGPDTRLRRYSASVGW